MDYRQAEPVAGSEFHSDPNQGIYRGELGEAVYKRADSMVVVEDEPCHHNPAEQGDRAGHGRTLTRWVFSEDGSKAEGLTHSGFNLLVDFYLEPGVAVGLHPHHDKEEVYYVLEGELDVTTETSQGAVSARLGPGDAHFIRLGQSHYAVAGPAGARAIAVCFSSAR